MIVASTFRGKRVALFGLGASGLATARALTAGGADVFAWDDTEASREKAVASGLPIVDLAAADWSQFSSLILAPGIPLTHPAPHWTVLRARESGVEIIGDVEIFCRERNALSTKCPFVAITGTNGKSTTTALIAHLYENLGDHVEMGGNIGVPILSLAPLSSENIYVIELSTFQIDLTPSLNPTIGVLLNLTPDHLDRHGTMAQYAAIKERLVAQSESAVIAIDDSYTQAIAARLAQAGKTCVLVSSEGGDFADGIAAAGSKLFRKIRGSSILIADLAGISSLRGRHNAQNAGVAVAALGDRGLESLRVQKGLSSFPGLAHRMEEVGRQGRVLFVNDSKATNADAAEKALSSFKDIFWIAGGVAKEGGVEPLRPLFSHIRKAYLIGKAAKDFAETLKGIVPFVHAETLSAAIALAAADAAASEALEPVVLLSPACASYDQFANFEKRGDAFRASALALIAQFPDAGEPS